MHIEYMHKRAVLRPRQYLLGFTVVPDNLLNKVFGLAVRVRAAADRVLLVDGKLLRVSIHRGRAAEDQIMHLVSLHHLGHVQIQINTAHAFGQQPEAQTS